MYIMTREKQESDKVSEMFITNPRLNLDDVRKVKAAIRYKTKELPKEINKALKYGRCLSIGTINGALYEITIRLDGKDSDTIYVMRPMYNNNEIKLDVVDSYSVDTSLVNI